MSVLFLHKNQYFFTLSMHLTEEPKIKASINDLLADLLPKLLKDINMKRKRLLPSMDVILNSEELAHLPEECLHTLHLHVTPNNIKLYTEE